MKDKSKISAASLKRMPQYLRVLKEKQKQEEEFISSATIAKELMLNPIQVRKDLAFVSESDGKPGVGFEVKELIKNLEDFLGMKKSVDAIIVGAGRLGHALLNYNGFENNINILAAFDLNTDKCDNDRVFNVSEMEKIINSNNIDIGIIAVPRKEAQKVANQLVEYGIKAIWNFAPTHIKVPEDVVLKNEDLSASLSILLKMLENKSNNN